MKYAENTQVSVEKSRAEIESIVTRYGASCFGSMMDKERAVIMFEVKDRRLRFSLPLPDRTAKKFTERMRRGYYTGDNLDPADAMKLWEQACRQKWRALCLTIKAKLESVESGIATFDEAFMPHFVLPTGLTIGETLLPDLSRIINTGALPPMLPALPGPGQSTAN